jgi:predicted ATP-dependent serine protease
VVGVVGSPGIGKSRLVREVSAMADAGDIDVFTAFCESHTSQVPVTTSKSGSAACSTNSASTSSTDRAHPLTNT